MLWDCLNLVYYNLSHLYLSVRQDNFFYQFSNLLASPYNLFFLSHRQIIRSLYRLERAVFKIFLVYCFPASFPVYKERIDVLWSP